MPCVRVASRDCYLNSYTTFIRYLLIELEFFCGSCKSVSSYKFTSIDRKILHLAEQLFL